MKYNNVAQQSKGFSLIELMVVIAITSLLMAIAIMTFISSRDKGYCSQAETDANNVAKALTAYFAVPTHEEIPTISELNLETANPDVSISGDPNETIYIRVVDRSGRCPDEYQKAAEGWSADVYETKLK
jgi:type IV pilus assembly protein PilA